VYVCCGLGVGGIVIGDMWPHVCLVPPTHALGFHALRMLCVCLLWAGGRRHRDWGHVASCVSCDWGTCGLMCMIGGIGPGPCTAHNVQDTQSACGGGFTGGFGGIRAFAVSGMERCVGGFAFWKLNPPKATPVGTVAIAANEQLRPAGC
jgi:hypothetical protein